MQGNEFKQAVELLEKLGHHSWPSLVRTVYLESAIYSAVSFVVMILFAAAGLVLFKKSKDSEDHLKTAGALAFAFCLMALFNGVGHLTDAMNPEGAAVVKFMKLLRG